MWSQLDQVFASQLFPSKDSRSLQNDTSMFKKQVIEHITDVVVYISTIINLFCVWLTQSLELNSDAYYSVILIQTAAVMLEYQINKSIIVTPKVLLFM